MKKDWQRELEKNARENDLPIVDLLIGRLIKADYSLGRLKRTSPEEIIGEIELDIIHWIGLYEKFEMKKKRFKTETSGHIGEVILLNMNELILEIDNIRLLKTTLTSIQNNEDSDLSKPELFLLMRLEFLLSVPEKVYSEEDLEKLAFGC